jgi:hypothetical protein
LIPAAEKKTKVGRVEAPPKVGAGAVANPTAQQPAQQAAQNRKTDK